jgi:hypothetical protein
MRAQAAIDNILTETLIHISRYDFPGIVHCTLYLNEKRTKDLRRYSLIETTFTLISILTEMVYSSGL